MLQRSVTALAVTMALSSTAAHAAPASSSGPADVYTDLAVAGTDSEHYAFIATCPTGPGQCVN